MASDITINRTGLKDRLKDQLVKLRERGFDEPELDDLVDLVRIACLLGPADASQQGKVEAVLELAIDGYEQDPESSDSEKVKEVARLWFGLDPTTRTLGQEERHEKAWKREGHGALSSFKSHRAPKIRGFLAGQLVEQYENHQPRLSEPDSGPSPEPTPTEPQGDEPKKEAPTFLIEAIGVLLVVVGLAWLAAVGVGVIG